MYIQVHSGAFTFPIPMQAACDSGSSFHLFRRVSAKRFICVTSVGHPRRLL